VYEKVLRTKLTRERNNGVKKTASAVPRCSVAGAAAATCRRTAKSNLVLFNSPAVSFLRRDVRYPAGNNYKYYSLSYHSIIYCGNAAISQIGCHARAGVVEPSHFRPVDCPGFKNHHELAFRSF
jgi:hypothetical protein